MTWRQAHCGEGKDDGGGHPPQTPREGRLLRELVHAYQALMTLFSREVGISPARLKLLHELVHCGRGGASASDLALRLGVTPALITRQVKELEKEGWVERSPDPRDGRRSYIRLSGRGDDELLKFHGLARQFSSELMESLSPEDIIVTSRVLVSLREKLESRRRRVTNPLDPSLSDRAEMDRYGEHG